MIERRTQSRPKRSSVNAVVCPFWWFILLLDFVFELFGIFVVLHVADPLIWTSMVSWHLIGLLQCLLV